MPPEVNRLLPLINSASAASGVENPVQMSEAVRQGSGRRAAVQQRCWTGSSATGGASILAGSNAILSLEIQGF